MRVPRPRLAVDRARYANVHGLNARRVIVLHSTESHDRPGTDDVKGILTYLEDKDYGVHYVVDGDGNIGRGAYHDDLVYHCKGANSYAIGIEMIGQAKWSTKNWLWFADGKQRKQLRAVAHLVAHIADRESIPLMLSTTHGVARHADFPEGGHWDPGKGFPMGYVLKRARMLKRFYNNKRP